MAEKIYTRTGDLGETGLFGGPRVAKDHARIEAYGTVDELNSVLGLARSAALPPELDVVLARAQNDLFDLGAELATPDAQRRGLATTPAHVTDLEQAIDRFEKGLPPLKEFILPGGTAGAGWLHLARTVCRRAERRVVALARLPDVHVSPEAVIYLNRLSDLLFVMARSANAAASRPDIPWRKR